MPTVQKDAEDPVGGGITVGVRGRVREDTRRWGDAELKLGNSSVIDGMDRRSFVVLAVVSI